MEKASALEADAVILDLEDAVGPDGKAAARSAVCDAVAAHRFARAIVRINALTSPWGVDDIKDAAEAGPHAILLPKVESAADLVAARMLAPGIDLWAMIETPAGVLALEKIAAFGTPLRALVLGANDLTQTLGARHQPGRANLQPVMAQLVLAARAHGLLALDSVHNDLTDSNGFAQACAQARDFGFDGKTLIHPGQIAAARSAFAPTADEIASARALLAEFARPKNAAKGAILFQGRMVERLDADVARRLLDETR